MNLEQPLFLCATSEDEYLDANRDESNIKLKLAANAYFHTASSKLCMAS
jgi:hypothetical protein